MKRAVWSATPLGPSAPVLAVIALLFFAGNPVHAGMIGPSLPGVWKSQYSLGIGYARMTTPMKVESGKNFGEVDLRQNVAFLQYQNPAYSFSENGAGFVRAGAADADDGNQFHDGYRFFGGFGIRDTWYGGEATRFSVGTVAQANFFSGYDMEKSFLAGFPSKVTVHRLWDASLAVSAQWQPAKGVVLYGGPMGFFRTAKVRRIVGGGDEKAWYREKNPIGGFVGGRFSILDRWSLEVEGQYVGALIAGATVSRAF